MRRLAEQYDPTAKTKNPNAQKAARILGISEEEATKKAEAKKAEKEAEKAAKEAEKKAAKENAKKTVGQKKNPSEPAEKPDAVLDAK